MEWTASTLADQESILLRPCGSHEKGNVGLFWRWAVEVEANGELKFSGYDYSKEYPGNLQPRLPVLLLINPS
ncbi:MAG: hypothetical protein CL862_00970 [Cyanobium sp. NAT70]|nr:hypothetical protein [Cyanobium sp. NAT70]|tara:strand:- start:151 stop:366 length:216 start_codon:yes stop_codon:yes gene_type:complete